jgi:N-acetylmuramoyl-L-alanine amidase
LLLHQRVWNFLQRHRAPGLLKIGGQATLLGLLLIGATVDAGIQRVQAQTGCANGDQVYRVVKGDTLGGIAQRDSTSIERLAAQNSIKNPNLIYTNQRICIPRKEQARRNNGWTPENTRGSRNIFPYGACTWWANQRYFQLHGVYVPWKTGANAWEWKFRAYQFHWRVSSRPRIGAIIDLQPWVEGAYSFGHVAVVERVLGNGHVIASTMNWGAFPWRVTYVEYAPGPGVSFISQ